MLQHEKLLVLKRKKNSMAQKTNPIAFRLAANKEKWFIKYHAKTQEEYSDYVYKNVKIREYLENIFNIFGCLIHTAFLKWTNNKLYITISYVVISNTKQQSLLKLPEKNINNNRYLHFSTVFLDCLRGFTSNSIDIVLTLRKQNINFKSNITKFQINYIKILKIQLRQFSKYVFFKPLFNILLLVSRLRNSANLLAQYITNELRLLKKHDLFLFVLKQLMLRILKSKISKIKGIKVLIKGRLNNRPRASSWSLVVGKVPLQTINAEISYNQKIAYTKNGTLGIKVWVSENTL